MGNELGTANESENLAGSVPAEPPAVALPKAVALPPRPVSLPPRPASSSLLPARPSGSPPPSPQRNPTSTPLPRPSQQPPPPPVRSSATSAAPPSATSSARPLPPSMRPAPPPVAHVAALPLAPTLPTLPPDVSTPALPSAAAASALSARQDAARIQALLADVMSARQELTEKTSELRKATAERDALRTQLASADAQLRELASALRAEAQLRSEAVETHAATNAALRARVTDLEIALQESRKVTPEPVGLRRIRGIGPAYERALLGLGITTVAQIAALSPEDIARIAPQIKAQADRILRDDWVGQAQLLAAE